MSIWTPQVPPREKRAGHRPSHPVRSLASELHASWGCCLEGALGPHSDPQEPGVSLQPASAAAGPPVLVVDDDEIVRDSVARVLRYGGYAAFKAHNGQAALDFVERAAPCPALILLDESMPGLDGAAVRKRLREIAPDVKVVIISGLGASEYDNRSADAVLEKPVRADALLETVRRVLSLAHTPAQ